MQNFITNPLKLISGLLIAAFLAYLAFTMAQQPKASNESVAQLEQVKTLIDGFGGTGNNYQAATQIIQKMLEKNPDNPYTILAKAKMMEIKYTGNVLGNKDSIRKLTAAALAKDPKLPDAYTINAHLDLSDGKYIDAQAAINKALEIDGEHKEAWFLRGKLFQRAEKLPEAEHAYLKALTLYQDDARKSKVYHDLGSTYVAMGPDYLDKAKEAMKSMVDLDQKSPWTLVNYAAFLNKHAGDYKGAVEYAHKALLIMDFDMANLQLAMGTYAQWSKAYLSDPALETQMVDEKPIDPQKIYNMTGITEALAIEYGSAVMKKARIAEALIHAKLQRLPANKRGSAHFQPAVMYGEWQCGHGKMIDKITYNKDGSFNGTVEKAGSRIAVYAGKWTLKGKVLDRNFEASEPPLPPDIRKLSDTVLFATADELIQRDDRYDNTSVCQRPKEKAIEEAKTKK